MITTIIENLPYILLAILAFSILVIWHELGHFTLAKLNGIKVEEFSLGMGKKLFGIKGKETEYNVRMLPIGGYVKMLGEEGECDDKRAFTSKSPLRRLSVVAAGPINNLILAIVLFAISISILGTLTPKISKIEEGSPAQKAGIQAGYTIKEANETQIGNWTDFITFMAMNNGEAINVKLEKDGDIKEATIKPKLVEEENMKRYIIGVFPTEVKPSFGQSIKYGLNETESVIKQTFMFFGRAFKGQVKKEEVGGPLTIFKVSGKFAKMGIPNLIFFMALISVQLGIFNIMPFPALDGGWIFLLLIQIITGKKLDDDKVGMVNYIGFMILMALMVLVTVKDILYPLNI